MTEDVIIYLISVLGFILAGFSLGFICGMSIIVKEIKILLGVKSNEMSVQKNNDIQDRT